MPAPSLVAPAAAVTHGAAIAFETLSDDPGALRLRDDVTLLRVVAGAVRLTTGDGERVLATGDEAIVAAGAPHRLGAVDGEARILAGFRATLP